MNARRSLRLALCLIATALVLIACRSTPAAEPVTIRFGFQEFDQPYFEALVEEFRQANPAITVELVPHTWAQVASLGPDDADAFMVQLGYPLVEDRAGLLSLDSLIESDRDFDAADYYPGLLDLLRAEGKAWAIPAGVDPIVMYYNRDLFDAAGVPYPEIGWTWDNFLVTARALTDAEGETFGFISDPVAGVPAYFAYQHGGALVDDWTHPTRFTLDDPLTIEAAEWFARLIHEHHVHPTPAQARRLAGGDGRNAAFRCVALGRAAMWAGGFSERGGGTWMEPWDFEAGMAPLPREAYSATAANFDVYAISDTTDYAQAAWEWISFLSRRLHNRQAPARRSLAESEAFREQVGEEAAAVVRASLEMDVVQLNDTAIIGFLREAGFHAVYAQALQQIYSGQQTATEALQAAQAALSR